MAARRRLPTGAQDTILPHKNPTSVTVFREERSLTVAARIEAAHAHPKSIRNVVPLPFSLSTAMRPLWSLTTDCTIASPSPVPCVFVV